MKNKGLIATIVVLVAVIITLIAVVFLMQMPTILSVEGFFLNKKKETTIISTTEIVTTERETETETTTIPVPKKTTKIENYNGHNNHVSIDYPQIEGMDDLDLQAKINEKIKTNALSIVPLYPISTALQNLNISCGVKRFDDSYITVIYEGRVVGRTNKNTTSNNNSTRSNNSNAVGGKDPYLDGFVDPLAVYNQFNQYNIAPTSTISYNTETTTSRRVEVERAGQNTKVLLQNDRIGTADEGPVVSTIARPTAPARSSSYIDNTAENNPIFGYTSVSTVDQKIFYTNTIDLRTGQDMSLSDYVTDLDKLSRWIRSSKVEFTNIDDKDRKKVREYVNLTVQSRYLEQMKNADFRNKGLTQWPKIFSYRDEDGTVYLSVKLSSKLGNYAIVKYKP